MEGKVYLHPGGGPRYKMQVFFKKLDDEATIPSYAREGDACLDFTATSKTYDNSGNVVYGTGIALAIPEGYVGLLYPRSSVSNKLQILANSVGVIDSGYRGEIMFKFKPVEGGHSRILASSEDQYEIGHKIGQLLILPYPQIELLEIGELPESERGDKGWGSTGK